jgi:hypothetical protein
MTSAHIAGLPLEESLSMLAPALGILAVLLGIWLRGLAASLRRRKPGTQNR